MTDPTPPEPTSGPAGPGIDRTRDPATASTGEHGATAGPATGPTTETGTGPTTGTDTDTDTAADPVATAGSASAAGSAGSATGPPTAAGPLGAPLPRSDLDRGPTELRRPLLMDPAGARPAGFAPPGSPWAPTAGTRSRPTPLSTPSRLAGPSPGSTVGPVGPPDPLDPLDPLGPLDPLDAGPGWPAQPDVPRPESAFGPVSRIVTVSVRTPTSRIDLVLPDRTPVAEVLETVLDLAPRTLREQALAHGGWILRTAAGRPLPGSTTLLDEGITAGDTLVLIGADVGQPPVVHDDAADAVAEAVRADTRAWPAGAGRITALAAGAAFGLLAILSVPALGPPWMLPALVLAGLALVAQLGAGLLARRRGDVAAAVTVGLLSVPAGAMAATLATAAAGLRSASAAGPGAAGPAATGSAGVASLGVAGPLPWLAGVVAAGVLAAIASATVGSRRVVFGAVVTGAGLLLVAGAPALLVALTPTGVAALVAGLAVGLMPVTPSLALRLAAFEPDPLPGSVGDLDAAARQPVDGGDSRTRTRRAVRLLTALLHGLAWPVLGAGLVLALAGPPVTGPALAAVAGAALLLRARLFRTVGQRVPLLFAGLACLVAVPAGLVLHAASWSTVVLVIGAAVASAGTAVAVAGRRTPRTPATARAAEIADLLLTVAVFPLTAAALGAFTVIRGLGG